LAEYRHIKIYSYKINKSQKAEEPAKEKGGRRLRRDECHAGEKGVNTGSRAIS